MRADEAKNLAYKQAQKIQCIPDQVAFATFSSIKFDVPVGQSVDQEEVARQNLELDPQSCLGRVAVVAAIMEQHHAKRPIMLGEVLDDYFRNIMLKKLKEKPSLARAKGFLQELLMYEEPHAVVWVDGVQFEPLSLEFGEFVEHPELKLFLVWKAIAASATVSEAWLERNPIKKLQKLMEAEKICPGMVLVKENMVEPLESVGMTSEATSTLEWLLEKRPCARTLYVAHILLGKEIFHKRLVETYTEEIIKYILEEYKDE